MHTGFWWGNLKKRGHLEDPGLDGKMVLNWIFKKWDGGIGLDRPVAEEGQVAGSCGCGKKTSGSTKCGEFLD